MKRLILLIGFIGFILTGCKKESDTSGCWKCIDALGNDLQVVCGDSEQDAFNKSGIIGGVHTIEVFRQFCHKK